MVVLRANTIGYSNEENQSAVSTKLSELLNYQCDGGVKAYQGRIQTWRIRVRFRRGSLEHRAREGIRLGRHARAIVVNGKGLV